MTIELKKITRPDDKVWYAVTIDGFYTGDTFYATEKEGIAAFDKVVERKKNGPPSEETILSTEI